MTVLYRTQARAVGGREGRAQTPDGLLDIKLAVPKELGGPGNATNPEQLFAAGYAACFENAIRHIARTQKIDLKSASVTAKVALLKTSDVSFGLEVSLDIETEGPDSDTAKKLVDAAHIGCPYSNAIAGNVDVALNLVAR